MHRGKKKIKKGYLVFVFFSFILTGDNRQKRARQKIIVGETSWKFLVWVCFSKYICFTFFSLQLFSGGLFFADNRRPKKVKFPIMSWYFERFPLWYVSGLLSRFILSRYSGEKIEDFISVYFGS